MKKVTVLMTAYKEKLDEFLCAYNSIINQTYNDFDFLIVVDNPDNEEIIDFLSKEKKNDKRINFIVNDKNIGLPLSLNKGIDLINTKYIARMDSDDFSEKNRLEKQLKFAESNPNIDLFGSKIIFMDSELKKEIKKQPAIYTKLADLKKYSMVSCRFNHPTYFGKTEVFKKEKYRNLKYSQDYDFNCRLLEKGYILSNMDEYLLKYRSDNDRVSDDKKIRTCITTYFIRKYYSKSKLNETDILSLIEDEYSKCNRKLILKSLELDNKAFEYKFKKNYFMSIVYLFMVFCISKYHRYEILKFIKIKLFG